MKTIQIPMTSNPFTVVINNSAYSYKAGDFVEVPDDVAEAIENALELSPRASVSPGRLADLVSKSIAAVTADDLAGVTEIGNYAFSYCMKLTDISFAETITAIGVSAFAYCYALKRIVIPDRITSIGTYAFSKCTALTDITIGRGVTSIGGSAFNLVGKSKSATYRILNPTPPAIETDTFQIDSLAKIIVPKGCGAVYKAAANWSDLAAYIEEAQDGQ